jgi:cation:H+ antiporter
MAMFLLGLLLLVLGADSLLRGASGLGQRFGLTPFLAGLLLAGFVAAIPNWRCSRRPARQARAARGRRRDRRRLAGFALALGVAALAAPLAMTMRVASAMLVFVLVAAGLVLAFALDGAIARWEGAILLAAYAGLPRPVVRRGREQLAPAQAEFVDIAETATGFRRTCCASASRRRCCSSAAVSWRVRRRSSAPRSGSTARHR